jgi:hypothetical protein
MPIQPILAKKQKQVFRQRKHKTTISLQPPSIANTNSFLLLLLLLQPPPNTSGNNDTPTKLKINTHKNKL